MTTYKHLYYRDICKIDKNNGNLIEQDSKITDFPSDLDKVLPIYSTNDLYTGHIDLDYNEDTTGLKESNKGQVIYSARDTIFLERMNLTLPLNPKLYSGASIDLNVYMVTKEIKTQTKSKNFSGRYVIERCTHVWDGKNQRGYTKIVIGRKYLNLSSGYLLKEKLIT